MDDLIIYNTDDGGAFEDDELDKNSVVSILETTASDGKTIMRNFA